MRRKCLFEYFIYNFLALKFSLFTICSIYIGLHKIIHVFSLQCVLFYIFILTPSFKTHSIPLLTLIFILLILFILFYLISINFVVKFEKTYVNYCFISFLSSKLKSKTIYKFTPVGVDVVICTLF